MTFGVNGKLDSFHINVTNISKATYLIHIENHKNDIKTLTTTSTLNFNTKTVENVHNLRTSVYRYRYWN